MEQDLSQSHRELLEQLSRHYGLYSDYWDIRGQQHFLKTAARVAVLEAMEVRCRTEAEARASLDSALNEQWERLLPPVTVITEGESRGIPVCYSFGVQTLHWHLKREDGSEQEGLSELSMLPCLETNAQLHKERREFFPHASLPAGYHTLRVAVGEQSQEMPLIVAPQTCYLPAALEQGARRWGISAQLYGVRSEDNWGIGDFGDLWGLVDYAAERGADFVGLNPLHALAVRGTGQSSPYTPISRMQTNALYIDIPRAASYLNASRSVRLYREPQIQERIAKARNSELVDYETVGEVKFEILEELYREFTKQHIAGKTPQAAAYQRFVLEQGESLRRYALYAAIQEHCFNQDAKVWGWPVWPEEYRQADSPAVEQFYLEHLDRIGLYQFIEWLADYQLGQVSAIAAERGLDVGLYLDVALGSARGGAEVWANQSLFALKASSGAPPDDLGPQGQNWGLPPYIPHRLREAGYAPFIAVLRAVMRHSGAIRLDHVMSLMRLFWVPQGLSAEDGAYVAYSLEDLTRITALESRRNQCLIIGEDLGTVPDEVREAMSRCSILSYKVLYFTKNAPASFIPASLYPRDALVVTSTHDLPTLRGYLNEHDLDLRRELKLHPEEVLQNLTEDRKRDRDLLFDMLFDHGFFPNLEKADATVRGGLSFEDANVAFHAYLASSPSMLQAIQLEDLLGEENQVNLPGTTDEHPNWQRKLSVSLEKLGEFSPAERVIQAVRAERSK